MAASAPFGAPQAVVSAAMLGVAVLAAHGVQLEGLASGLLPALVAALTFATSFLVARPGRTVTAEVLPPLPGWKRAGTSSDSRPRSDLVEAAPMAPRNAVAVPLAVPDLRPEKVLVAVRVETKLRSRAENGWKMAACILDPSDDAWRQLRAHVAHVAHVARPATRAVIEAVVVAARRQWHSGVVPLKKDAFIADILAAPEVVALGTMGPRMEVVRKILDGEHPSMKAAMERQKGSAKQRSA